MNVQQLNDANQEITKLKAQLVSQKKEHDAEITNIEDVNSALLNLSDARIKNLVNDRDMLRANVNSLVDGVRQINLSAAKNKHGETVIGKTIDFINLVSTSNNTPAQCIASVKADAVGNAMQKFRYEFEGARDTDSIEAFFDDIESKLREAK